MECNRILWDSDPMLYAPWLRTKIAKGRGIGVGKDYLPWIKTRDIRSRGTSAQIQSMRFQRVFHLLSNLETTYFYILERDFSVIDIREQFPILSLPETIEIALNLGVKHPYKNGKLEPFTIDFLLTIETPEGIKFVARSIKTPEDSNVPSIRLRLKVEEIWCNRYQIEWKLVDTTSFTPDMLRTLRSIRGWYRSDLTIDEHYANDFANAFLDCYESNVPLHRLLKKTNRKISADSAQAYNWFNYCAWSKKIPLSLQSISTLADVVVLNRYEKN